LKNCSQPVTLNNSTQPEIAPVLQFPKFQQELLQKSLNQLEQLSAEWIYDWVFTSAAGQIDAAIKTWTDLKERSPKESSLLKQLLF